MTLPLPGAAVAAFAGLALVFVLAPGMSTAVVLRNTAEGGHRAGLLTALGIAAGNATWAIAAGAGLGAILSRNPGAITGIRAAGACCLAWLGMRSLTRARALRRDGRNGGQVRPHTGPLRGAATFVEGAVTNLLNPSIPVFYAASVQPFIRPTDPFAPAFALLAAVHVSMALACHSAYATVFGRVATGLAVKGRAWVLHAVTGAALMGLAAASAASVF